MRTTFNVDDVLLRRAAELVGVGIDEKRELTHRALEALIATEASARLAKLGGSEKKLRPASRRRSACPS